MFNNKSKLIIIAKCSIFLIIFFVILVSLGNLMYMQTDSYYWASQKSLYKFEKNSIDGAICGSSIVQYGLLSMEMYKNTSLKFMSRGVGGEKIEVTYYKLQEMYKYQNPNIVIVDLYHALMKVETDNTQHYCIDGLSLNFSKVNLINNIVPKEQRLEYIFYLFYYHTNWKNIVKNGTWIDYELQELYMRDNIALPNSYNFEFGKIGSAYEYVKPEKEYVGECYADEYIKKIIDLVISNNSVVIFTCVPKLNGSTYYESNYFEAAKEKYANNLNVFFLNFNYIDFGLDFEEDFFDSSHLNYYGGKKLTNYVSCYILNNLDKKYLKTEYDKNWDDAYFEYENKLNDEINSREE